MCQALDLQHKKGPAMQLRRHSHEIPRGCKRYYKFCFVRNPFDRMVSVYFRGKKRGRVPSWFSFLDFCHQIDTPKYYHPWMCDPQVRWTENTNLEFIGRFENLEKDFQRVVKAIDFEPCELPWENAEKHGPYRDYYCDESTEMIGCLFKEDFETFGYTTKLRG